MPAVAEYKQTFVDFLLETGALKVGEDYKLKSGRFSPHFVNIGDFNDGKTSARLGQAYAAAIIGSGLPCDGIYGIPEKGVGLAPPVAIGMDAQGRNVFWFFTRKTGKTYGEMTGSAADKRKNMVVGRMPVAGQQIMLIDDVLTTGGTKYETVEFLDSLFEKGLKYPGLIIAVDRQEVGIDGKSAVAEFTERTGIPVVAIATMGEIYGILRERGANPAALERMANYLRMYGTKEGIAAVGKIPEYRVAKQDRSVIPACDMASLEHFEELVKQTGDLPGIGGYKVGFSLGLRFGLPRVVETARKHTDKPVIYDHQKAGTDIPDTGEDFMKLCKEAGVDSVILFSQAGPETHRAWLYRALDKGLKPIVGGRMTHPAYAVSEGGWITDEGALDMYRIAARAGVTHFVAPGNKAPVIRHIRELIEAEGVTPVFHSPGFVDQGGRIADAASEAGGRFHGIVGRAIVKAPDMRKAAIEMTSQLYSDRPRNSSVLSTN